LLIFLFYFIPANLLLSGINHHEKDKLKWGWGDVKYRADYLTIELVKEIRDNLKLIKSNLNTIRVCNSKEFEIYDNLVTIIEHIDKLIDKIEKFLKNVKEIKF
jgi:hypothetical protein